MSVVGPRQPLYYEYERYDERQRHRLDVLPGITGLYQVTARSRATFEEMVEIDLEYIRRRSFWLDLKIIVLTPWVMLTGKGAALMARVLVTGGAGFIGSHTVDLLLEKGYAVRILDNLQPRVHPRGMPPWVPQEAEFIQGDVANPADLAPALRGVDYVIHLAAYQDYLPDFSTFIHTNTESTALIFELIVAAEKLPVRKIVFASSQSVCGEGLLPLPRAWPADPARAAGGAVAPRRLGAPLPALRPAPWRTR